MNRDLSKFEPPKIEPDGLTKELFGLPPMKRTPAKKSERGKELVEIVRCKNCIHRPIKGEDTHDIEPPKDSRGYDDYACPCLNEDDYWYSWCPSDEWFCADGEAKGELMMSGGSYNYIYSRLSDECEGEMHDAEMNEMIKDLCKVLHDLEWWQSEDYSEEQYRETLKNFKEKWFKAENRSTVYTLENTTGLRDKFADGVTTVFSSVNAFLDFIEDREYSSRYDVFLNYNDETYIIDRETGKYINWYKASHIGRDIHTNIEHDKIVEFLREFKEDNDGIHED